jgi:hypothetical protein
MMEDRDCEKTAKRVKETFKEGNATKAAQTHLL